MSRTITVSDDVYFQFHEISNELGISFNDLIEELITALPHPQKQNQNYPENKIFIKKGREN